MPDSPADRLELFMAREFVRDYLHKALRGARAVKIDANRIYMAARFQGLKISTATLAKVLEELQRKTP
jgi:hypothetical protein